MSYDSCIVFVKGFGEAPKTRSLGLCISNLGELTFGVVLNY